MQDQEYVHREVMDFLTNMQPGTRMAIFMLGSTLAFCLQGFTTDNSALLAALNDQQNGLKDQKSSLLHSRSDRADDTADVARYAPDDAGFSRRRRGDSTRRMADSPGSATREPEPR